MHVRNGLCEEEVRMDVTKEECCSSIGAAWGSPCEVCSKSGGNSGPDGTPPIGPGTSDIYLRYGIMVKTPLSRVWVATARACGQEVAG